MVYWTILFYQVYRNHAKSNGIKPLFFFEAKGLLSQPHQIEEKVRFGQVPSIFFYNLIKKKLLQMLLNRHS